MKTSRIIALIVAIAIGLVIAVQLTQKETSTPTTTNGTETHNSDVSIESTKLEPNDTKETLSSTTETNTDLSNSNDLKNITLNTSDDVEKIDNRATLIQENKTPMITLKTNKGDIEIALNADKAPISAENFLKYAKEGQYNGTIFHRVIPGFMIQGGGFEPGMQQKQVGAQSPMKPIMV